MTQPEVSKTTNHKAPQAYKGNGNHEWEKVIGNTYRLRVPGGWLYVDIDGNTGNSTAMAFVPTPVHVI